MIEVHDTPPVESSNGFSPGAFNGGRGNLGHGRTMTLPVVNGQVAEKTDAQDAPGATFSGLDDTIIVRGGKASLRAFQGPRNGQGSKRKMSCAICRHCQMLSPDNLETVHCKKTNRLVTSRLLGCRDANPETTAKGGDRLSYEKMPRHQFALQWLRRHYATTPITSLLAIFGLSRERMWDVATLCGVTGERRLQVNHARKGEFRKWTLEQIAYLDEVGETDDYPVKGPYRQGEAKRQAILERLAELGEGAFARKTWAAVESMKYRRSPAYARRMRREEAWKRNLLAMGKNMGRTMGRLATGSHGSHNRREQG